MPMAHLIQITHAKSLKNKWKHYAREKMISLRADEDESFSECSKSKLKQEFWWSSKLIKKIQTPGTIQSIVWKSFLGFIGGIVLTYVSFFFFHLGVNFTLWTSTYVCALAGIFLSLGLAFSSKIRCFVLLLLPVFFSKEGRQALLTYALFLSFTGPGRNTMHNLSILSDSMSCGQEMVKRTLKQIVYMTKAPVKAIGETVQKVVKAVKEVEAGMRKFLMKVKRVIISTLAVIKEVTAWLGSIVNMCNKKIGTPFQRCMATFDEAIADCKAKLGIMDFLCHVVHIVKALCYTVKCLDFICLSADFVSGEVVGVVRKKLREFNLRVDTLFYVSIEFSHSYELETTFFNTTKAVPKTILQKLSKKVEKLQTIFSFFGFVFSLFFLFLLLKVYYYRYKYMTSDRYDNVYISDYIVELDAKRARMDRETVLPLEPRERKLYGKPISLRLLKNEKSRISESAFLLGLTSFKIITFLVVDYGLFWILITIYEAGRNGLIEVQESRIGIHVEGKGILPDFYRKLGKKFRVPDNPNTRLNPLHCLPDPVHPDIARYIRIVFLVTLCWILTVTEAYGLRFRGVVMSYYHPHRARERAVWLYNHIIRSRGSFVRHARRQLRRKCHGGVHAAEEPTPTRRLLAHFPLLGTVFGRSKENDCLICGVPSTRSAPLKRCRTGDCQGRYCLECFASLENTCTLCQHPIDYGDVSDVSEEIDSSEEELWGGGKRSRESECWSDDREDSEEFLTFEEMEKRDRFRDVEANRLPDYAKLGDLYPDRAALQRRLKAAIQKRLQQIEREKQKAHQKNQSRYQRVKLELQNAISKLKDKKLDQIRAKKTELKQRFLEKIRNLRHLEDKTTDLREREELMATGSKRTRSRVSFSLEEGETSSRRNLPNYIRLKNELKAKIESLKRRRGLRSAALFDGEGSA